MMTLTEPGTFVSKNFAPHGERQEYSSCARPTPFAAPALWSLDPACSAPIPQSGGSGMPPDGPHMPTGFALEPDDDDENEPPYSRIFSEDEEQDGGHITYPPVDADLDIEATRDLDDSLTDEQLRRGTIRPFPQPTGDCLPPFLKEVE